MHEEAAQLKVVQLDDTTARINQLKTEFNIAVSTGHKPEQTGIHTIGFLGKTKSQHTLLIFKTGLQ